MKLNIGVFLVFALMIDGMANAQVRPGIKVGGVNSSEISKTTLDSKEGLYIGGAFVKIPISNYYALQPEILYSNQGGASNSPDYSDVNIHYLSIGGVPNKFYVGQNNGFHFILGLGGLDINLKNNFVNFTNFNIDEEISPVDVAVFGGLGYEFPFGLALEARYKQGGTISVDFLGSDDLYEEAGSNLNGVFQIGASYKFKL